MLCGHADAKQKTNSECCPVKSLLTGCLWDMKSQSCLCMQMSKAEPDFSDCVSVLACVSETTIGGLSAACTRYKTMSAGRCAWIKLCIGSLLHCPFSVSLCYLSTSAFPPHPLPPPKGSFREIMAVTIASIVFFCEVRMGLCVSLNTHTHSSAIYRLALRALEGSRDRGGEVQVVNGSTMDRWSTKQAKM